jgi:hypothetical protein
LHSALSTVRFLARQAILGLRVDINVLGLGESRQLFSSGDLSNLARQSVLEAQQAVQQLSPDDLLNSPTDDLIVSLVEKYSFTCPTLRRDDAYIDGPHEVDLR